MKKFNMAIKCDFNVCFNVLARNKKSAIKKAENVKLLGKILNCYGEDSDHITSIEFAGQDGNSFIELSNARICRAVENKS